MQRLFGRGNGKPKVTPKEKLDGAISGVSEQTLLLLEIYNLIFLFFFKTLPGRRTRIQSRRETGVDQRGAGHVPATPRADAHPAGHVAGQVRAAPEGHEAAAAAQDVRRPAGAAAAAELEHGAGGHDAGQPAERDGHGRGDEEHDEGTEETVRSGRGAGGESGEGAGRAGRYDGCRRGGHDGTGQVWSV